ncbi:MAG: pyruvate formate lyase family protein, partial [Candidatus Brocadiia bacterium]
MTAERTIYGPWESLEIRGTGPAVSLALPPALVALRERAQALQRDPKPDCPELTIAEAQAWADHTEAEDWLAWRARRVAARLEAMPLELEPGERVVGKPLLHEPNDRQREALEAAHETLSSMPPFPGGDAGHFHPDYEKLFRLGLGGILREIEERRQSAGGNPAFYDACRIALEGMVAYVRRVAEACRAMAETERDHADDWRNLAHMCAHLADGPPRTFHEGVQLMFLAQIALWYGEGHYLTSPGRMDQTLGRLYEADLAAGRISRQEALRLLCCHFIQMNRILWPGSAVAVLVGGTDPAGRDLTNELTYLCLAARAATRLVYPTVGLAWHEGTPPELMDLAVRLLGTGLGDPALFN